MIPLLTQAHVTALADLEATEPLSKLQLGSVLQRERIKSLADRCCAAMPGDIIEIGVYAGGTSTLLAQVARKYGRKLVCVDNWKGGDSYELDKIGEIFKSDMVQYADVLVLIEDDAHAAHVIEQIQSRRYCMDHYGISRTGRRVSTTLYKTAAGSRIFQATHKNGLRSGS